MSSLSSLACRLREVPARGYGYLFILALPGSRTVKFLTRSNPCFSIKFRKISPSFERALAGKRTNMTPLIFSLWANIHSPKSLSSVIRIRLPSTAVLRTFTSGADGQDYETAITSYPADLRDLTTAKSQLSSAKNRIFSSTMFQVPVSRNTST